MAISENDQVLAAAARYVFDGGNDDLANLLLSCQITGVGAGALTLTCPRAVFELISKNYNQPSNKGGYEIWTALRAAAGRSYDSSYSLFPTVGIVTRDPAVQAELLQLVRGSDAPAEVVEAIPIKPQQRPMLVTPIPILPVAPQKRDPILCFVIMPFAPAFRPIYEDAIRPAVQNAGLLCRRADDIMQPGDIMAQVWQSLLQASLVIADLTGVNGNVFYELGLAHVLGHQAILLTQNRADIPFDLQRQRYIEYQPTQQGVQELRASLEIALRHAHAMVK